MASELVNKPIRQTLLAMTATTACGMLITFLFQLVDTYFIGQLGNEYLAAVSFSFPIYFFIISAFIGLSAGVSSTVGRALGARDVEQAAILVVLALVLFIFLSAVLGLFGFFTISPVFKLLGADSQMIPLIGEYMQVIYLGMFALVGTLIANAALMAKGMVVKTTAVMALGGLVNAVLDYFWIFGHGPFPAWGLKGAACASVVSWCVTFAIMMLLLYRNKLFDFSLFQFLFDTKSKAYIRHILAISSPVVLAQVLNPVLVAVITRLSASYGNEAVAAYGVASRIQSLGLSVVLALSVVITPFAAQHYGAGMKNNLKEILRLSISTTLLWSGLFYVVLLFTAPVLVSVFTDSEITISLASDYFHIVGISYPAFGMVLVSCGFFNGIQKPRLALALTIGSYLVLSMPLVSLGALHSLNAMWVGLVIANLFGLLLAGYLLKRWSRNSATQAPKNIANGEVGS